MTTSVGYFVALYEARIRQLLFGRCFMTYGLAVLALFLSFCLMCKMRVLPDLWIMLWNILQAFAIYMVVCTFGMVRWRPLLFVGTFSLELYLVHGLPLMFWRGFMGVTNDYALWLLTFACALPMAFVAISLFRPAVFRRAYDRVSGVLRS